MKPMFADLGIPFPLFTAPETEADGYLGRACCQICGVAEDYAFTAFAAGEDVATCYNCLRAGRACIPKDTEVGAVDAHDADRGQTNAIGIPRTKLEQHGFRVIPHDLEPDLPTWSHALVPSSDLLELVRTPAFLTWQGCLWLFCCARPMVYIGVWKEPQFETHAGSADPAEFFRSVIPECPPFKWGQHAPLAGAGGPYVFRCQVCNRHRGYIDMP